MDGSPYDRPLGHRLGKRKRGSSPADGEEVVAQRHQTRTPFPSTYSQHATGSLPFQRASGSPDHRRPACRQEFEIAIICALPLEYDAVCLLFDEFWDDHVEVYGRATGDRNTYTNGRIGKHNVVLVLLYRMGKATAAGAAASMCLSYTGLRVVFLVGICGGVPFPRDGEEIVLGDVVISKTIIQYDFGRQYPGHFARKEAVGDTLGMPSKDVRNMLALLETRRGRGRLRTKTAEYLQELQANAKRQTIGNTYAYPGVVEDKLFDADYRHKHRGYPQCICHENHGQFGSVCAKAIASSCEDLGCDESFLVPRERFRASTTERRANAHSSGDPAIHVGLVASGDTVMKSGEDRDSIAARDGIVAFEMEGAGVWDEMPSVVVKGVCDYADCHKHKRWQDFAAAAAASAMKGLLNLWLYRDDAPQPARCAGSSTDMVTADAAVRVTVRDHHVVVTLERASQTTHVIRLASDELRDQPSFHRVTVIDARGIPLPFYLETVTSKELFTHILKERFGDLGTGKIERNEWSLEDRDTGQALDLSMPWLSLFKPNQVLFMSMIFRRRTTPSTRCPSCSFSNRGYTDTETQCKRCGLSYQRVQEIQKYEFLDAEQPTWLPSPGPSIIPPEVTGPQKPQLQTADDDISQYRRVSVIDTTFQMCKASSGDGVGSSRILLTARDLHEIEALARRLAIVSGLSVADCSTLLKDDEVTLSSIREELEWVPMPAPARGSREDYEGPANSSWADRMIFSPDTSFGEGLRVNFGDLDRSLDEANAQLRSLLEMTRPINPRAPLTRESSSSTLRPHGFADDSRLSDSTLRPFSQSLETPPSFNTWNDFLTGQGHGTAPRTAMYIPGLTEVNFVPPPLPPPRQLPFTRLSTETDNAQLDRQAVIHDKATDHDENYHPASGSPVRGGTAYHASSMANEMLKGEIEDGAGEALWLQHGRFFPSTADAHTRHTLERLNSNQEEVQAVEGIRRLG